MKSILLVIFICTTAAYSEVRIGTDSEISRQIESESGDDCSTLRLDKKENSPFKKMNVRKQQYNICAAHSAAQLYDYYRGSKGESIENETSAFAIAILGSEKYRKKSKPDMRNLGANRTMEFINPDEALASLRDYGRCNEEKMKNIFYALEGDDKTGPNNYRRLQEIYSVMQYNGVLPELKDKGLELICEKQRRRS